MRGAPNNAPILIVFGGLPGTGKTTLARALARDWNAAYLRIDEIEQALRSSGAFRDEVGPAGYIAAYALAELAPGRREFGARILEIEVICSDPVEHRRRVETRSSDVAGLSLPSWEDVLRRKYEPWASPRLVIDTAARGVAEALAEVRSRIGGRF